MARNVDIPVRTLGSVGIITDRPPHELPANVFTNANNARFNHGHIERIGGYVDIMADNTEQPKGNIHFKNEWQWGSTNSLWSYQPAGIPTSHQVRYTTTDDLLDFDKWRFTKFSGVLIASHTNTDPVYWNGVTPGAAAYNVLPDWGNSGAGNVTWRTKVMRGYKNQLIALNMTEDGVEYPLRVRFSDIAQPNVPPDEWNATSTTNSAGFIDLSNATSEIVDGYVLGDNFIIYTKNEVYMMSYVGGNEIYTVRQLFNDGGALQTGCVTWFNNTHLVVTADDVYVHDASTKFSVISDRIKESFFDEVRAFEYDLVDNYQPNIEVLTNKAKNEIWIFYTTDLNAGEMRAYYSKAAIWNYDDNTWTYTDIPNMTDVAIGVIPIEEIQRWDNTDPSITWDNVGPQSWNAGGQDIEERAMIGGGLNGFSALDQRLEASTTIVPFFLERLKIDLDEEIPQYNVSLRKSLKTMFPQFQGSGLVSIRIGVSDTPQENPNWQAAQTYNLDTDYKLDMRATGRYLSLRIESLDDQDWKFENYMWRLGGFVQNR